MMNENRKGQAGKYLEIFNKNSISSGMQICHNVKGMLAILFHCPFRTRVQNWPVLHPL